MLIVLNHLQDIRHNTLLSIPSILCPKALGGIEQAIGDEYCNAINSLVRKEFT
jgi:hypothetical protein